MANFGSFEIMSKVNQCFVNLVRIVLMINFTAKLTSVQLLFSRVRFDNYDFM